MDVNHQPVGDDDHAFNPSLQQQLQIPLEAAAIVVRICKDGEMRELVQRAFNATKDRSAVRILDIKDHQSDRGGALAAQGSGKLVGTIAELLRHSLNAFFRLFRNILSERSIVQYQRHRTHRKTALPRNIANGYPRTLMLIFQRCTCLFSTLAVLRLFSQAQILPSVWAS